MRKRQKKIPFLINFKLPKGNSENIKLANQRDNYNKVLSLYIGIDFSNSFILK